ncbi:nucleoporin 155 [Pelomyxa schiedti]|nr:nucleoporin 155 [Pelomyxa schiedti]
MDLDEERYDATCDPDAQQAQRRAQESAAVVASPSAAQARPAKRARVGGGGGTPGPEPPTWGPRGGEGSAAASSSSTVMGRSGAEGGGVGDMFTTTAAARGAVNGSDEVFVPDDGWRACVENMADAMDDIERNSPVDPATPFRNVLFSSDYVYTPPEALASVSGPISIPVRILQRHHDMQFSTQSGVYPEIEHAWVSVDNELFIWEYSKLEQCVMSQAFPSVIQATVVVKTKMTGDPKFILVVSTFENIHFLSLSLAATGRLECTPATMFPNDGGVVMRKLIGTDNGRIFACGSDGALYELEYQKASSTFANLWSQRHCRKVSSRSHFFDLGFIKWFASDDPLVDAVVDNDRHILYTLSSNSTLKVYDLGEHGDIVPAQAAELREPWKHIPVLTNQEPLLRQDPRLPPSDDVIDEMYERYMQAGKVPQDGKGRPSQDKWATLDVNGYLSKCFFQGIFPISKEDSRLLHLVAVTLTGSRVYFTTTNEFVDKRPFQLEILHCRLAPDLNSNKYVQVQASVYSKGFFLLSYDIFHGPATFAIAPSCPLDDSTQGKVYMETVSSLPIREPVLLFVARNIEEKSRGDVSRLMIVQESSPYATEPRTLQHTTSPDSFVCFTERSIRLIDRLRPTEEFALLLSKPKEQRGDNLQKFVTKYGSLECCSMALAVIMDLIPDVFFGTLKGSTSQLLSEAQRLFKDMGGTPSMHQQGVSPVPIITLSMSYKALCLLIARIIFPVWTQTLSKLMEEEMALNSLLEPLEKVLAFLTTYILTLHCSSYIFNRQQTAEMEENSATRKLEVFVSNCVQAIYLVNLLNKSSCRPGPIVRMEFLEFMRGEGEAHTRGRGELHDLMKNSLDKMAAETLNEELRKRCSFFWTDQDFLYFQGTLILEKAKKTKNSDDVKQAVLVFQQVAAAPLQELFNLCVELNLKDFFVQACLKIAQKKDPMCNSTHWKPGTENPPDVEASFQAVKECVGFITKLLQHPLAPESWRAAQIDELLKTDLYAVHMALYEYLLNFEPHAILKSSKPTWVERFLYANDLDFLAEWYLVNGEVLRASEVYYKLATTEDHQFLLILDHLKKALAVLPEDAPNRQEVTEKLHIATLQEHILLRLPGAETRLSTTLCSAAELKDICIMNRLWQHLLDFQHQMPACFADSVDLWRMIIEVERLPEILKFIEVEQRLDDNEIVYLIDALEQINYRQQLQGCGVTPKSAIAISMCTVTPCTRVLEVYDNLYTTPEADSFWMEEGGKPSIHLLEVICELAEAYTKGQLPTVNPNGDARQTGVLPRQSFNRYVIDLRRWTARASPQEMEQRENLRMRLLALT